MQLCSCAMNMQLCNETIWRGTKWFIGAVQTAWHQKVPNSQFIVLFIFKSSFHLNLPLGHFPGTSSTNAFCTSLSSVISFNSFSHSVCLFSSVDTTTTVKYFYSCSGYSSTQKELQAHKSLIIQSYTKQIQKDKENGYQFSLMKYYYYTIYNTCMHI